MNYIPVQVGTWPDHISPNRGKQNLSMSSSVSNPGLHWYIATNPPSVGAITRFPLSGCPNSGHSISAGK